MHHLSKATFPLSLRHCMSSTCVATCSDIDCNSVKVMMECVSAASDGDRVALQSMRFATPRSAGATCMTLGQLSKIQNNDNGSAPPRPEEAADDQVRSQTFCFAVYTVQQRDMLNDHWHVNLSRWSSYVPARCELYHSVYSVQMATCTT